jgi:ADP-ribose pyrophosphatase YjhB (NUDIX family)
MQYKNPCSTADIIIRKQEKILLIQRADKPFKNKWALPGGHLDYGKETLEQTAKRELQEETGLEVNEQELKLFGVYSAPDRDPRAHYITHVYFADKFKGKLKAGDDAKNVRWFPISQLPLLAFDHKKIIDDYIKKQEEKNEN